MKYKYTLLASAMLFVGCTSTPQSNEQALSDSQTPVTIQEISHESVTSVPVATMVNANPDSDKVDGNFPSIEFAKINVVAGTQTLTAANKLADELGVEFVEWTNELNPYEFYQLRSRRVRLNFEDPQAAFLELFDRSGLLPVYEKSQNTVTVYPYSMTQRLTTPHIFTPKFDRSERQQEQFKAEHEAELVKAKKLIEYNYYKDFTVQETVNAWAKHANYAGVVWFLDSATYGNFLSEKLKKSDFNVGPTPISVMNNFIDDEKVRQSRTNLPLSLVYEASTKKLIIHSMAQNEIVKSFDVKPTSLKENITEIGKFYGYTVTYDAPNYQIQTPYSTVLSRFIKRSVDAVAQQYPVVIEVIESSKNIIVKKDS